MSTHGKDLRTPLKRAIGLGSAKDGTGHFMLQRITAIALLLAGAWLIGLLLSLNSTDYVFVRATVADPLNATVLVAFLIAACWHAKLGLQVVIEDYVHTPGRALVCQLVVVFACALAALASVLAVIRIALGA